VIDTAIGAAIHFAFLLLLPPLMLGVINKTKAWFGGRRGAPLLQPYRDILKLLGKAMVISNTTTWVFRAGPIVTLSSILVAGTLMPFGPFAAPVAFAGDLILFAYLFALSRFFTASAALDTGSAFEGMGSAREVTFAVLTEPALFFAFLALAKLSGAFTLTGMLGLRAPGFAAGSIAPVVLVSLGLFVFLLAENCRIPVDDPNTHLELTMIHEVMVLDHSGPLLGMALYAASLKLFLLGSLLLGVVAPFSAGIAWIDWPLFAAELLALSAGIGVVESVMARLKLSRVPYLLVSAVLLCGSGFVLTVR
jgi:formate hydrogenlyase subunit 4